MTVEYLPVGIKCNLSCTYCYQEPMREAGNFAVPLNFHKVKESILKAGGRFSLFGGEPLLTPLAHLDEVFAFGSKIGNQNSLQTNGLLITPDHVDLFKKYNVNVGISIDGPGICNSARSSEFDTELIISNIRGLLAEAVPVSLIITLHALNALNMSDLLSFIDDMSASGVRWFNLHNLEVDNQATEFSLTLSDTHNFHAFRSVYNHVRSMDCIARFLPFNDIINLLISRAPNVSCIWGGCDPIVTPAVQGINPAGSLTNCGRTNKQGIDWLKPDEQPSFERYIALSLTEQEDGGCKDCEYFFACKGQCPGTAINGDWRNRTKDCYFWYRLIDYIREDLVARNIPVLDLEEANRNYIAYINNEVRQVASEHSDSPHGDAHGDHTDITGFGTGPEEGVRENELGLRDSQR